MTRLFLLALPSYTMLKAFCRLANPPSMFLRWRRNELSILRAFNNLVSEKPPRSLLPLLLALSVGKAHAFSKSSRVLCLGYRDIVDKTVPRRGEAMGSAKERLRGFVYDILEKTQQYMDQPAWARRLIVGGIATSKSILRPSFAAPFCQARGIGRELPYCGLCILNLLASDLIANFEVSGTTSSPFNCACEGATKNGWVGDRVY